MGKARLLAIIAAVFLLDAAPAEADHLNGHYADNRGIRIDLRQAGNTVTGAVLEPNGQQTTLSGNTDGNYAYGQVVGAHQGTFELKYVQGSPASLQLIVYDANGNLYDSAVYQRVGVSQGSAKKLPPAGAQPPAGGGFGGGQGQGQGQQQKQPPAGSQQGGAGSSLPTVD